jgi:hypothetical protein
VTVNLKNVSGGPLYFGRSNGRRVEDGEVIHVEGKLAAKSSQPDDAYLIDEGGEERLYPHSVWKMTGDKTKSDPDVPAPSSEGV